MKDSTPMSKITFYWEDRTEASLQASTRPKWSFSIENDHVVGYERLNDSRAPKGSGNYVLSIVHFEYWRSRKGAGDATVKEVIIRHVYSSMPPNLTIYVPRRPKNNLSFRHVSTMYRQGLLIQLYDQGRMTEAYNAPNKPNK